MKGKTRRLHKCIICGQMVEDTRESRTEHFQTYHAKPRVCICNICGNEIKDTIEDRQMHTLMHLKNKDKIKSPLYTKKEKEKQYAEAIPRNKGVKAKNRCRFNIKYERKFKIRARLIYNGIESNRRRH